MNAQIQTLKADIAADLEAIAEIYRADIQQFIGFLDDLIHVADA